MGSTASLVVVDDTESKPLIPNEREIRSCKPNTWSNGSNPLVKSTNERLNNRQMAMEKHDDGLVGFRILGKPESGSRVGSRSAVNDFREVKPVSFSLEGSNSTESLKPPPFVAKATRLDRLNFVL